MKRAFIFLLSLLALLSFAHAQSGGTTVMTGTQTQVINGQKIFFSGGNQGTNLVGWSQSGASAGLFLQDTHFENPALVIRRSGTDGDTSASPTLFIQAGKETAWNQPVMQIGGCPALSGDNYMISWGNGALTVPGGIYDQASGSIFLTGKLSIDPVRRQLVSPSGANMLGWDDNYIYLHRELAIGSNASLDDGTWGGPFTNTGTARLHGGNRVILDAVNMISLSMNNSDVITITGTGGMASTLPITAPTLNGVALSGSGGLNVGLGGTLGTAAYTGTEAYATATQGAKADTALQLSGSYSNPSWLHLTVSALSDFTSSVRSLISTGTSAWANGAEASGYAEMAGFSYSVPWYGVSGVPSLVNSLSAGSNISLSGSNGVVTISTTGLATAAQGAKADAALPASSGLAINATLSGTTGIRASGTGVSSFNIYQDPSNGSMVLAMPSGAISFYADRNGVPIMVFNGQIQCNDIVANLNVSSSIDAGIITTGFIPLARLPAWATNFSMGYPGQGVLAAVPVNVPYFFSWTSADSSGSTQTVAYRTASQIKTDMAMLTASTYVLWSGLASGGESTFTVTVTGATASSVPSVHLGWSAALPSGIEVKQAWVSADNTVSVTIRNSSGSTSSGGPLTLRATVHTP